MGFFRLKVFVFLMVFAAMVITLLPPLSSVLAKKLAPVQHLPHRVHTAHIQHNVKNNSWSLIREHKLSLRSIVSQLRFIAPVLLLLAGCMVAALMRLADHRTARSNFDSKPFPLPDRHVLNGVFLI